MSTEMHPRDLAPKELAVLELILERSFPGAERLRAQIAHVKVTGKCDCGCDTIDLTVSRVMPPSPQAYRPVPVDVNVMGPTGDLVGGIILFADNGYLSSLEIYSFGEPLEIPPIERLQIVPPSDTRRPPGP